MVDSSRLPKEEEEEEEPPASEEASSSPGGAASEEEEEEASKATDPWGFYVSGMAWWSRPSSATCVKKQEALDKKRERKWVAMVDAANGLEVFVKKKKTKLKERVRKGVPRQWRRSVWPALLDVEVKPQKAGTMFGGGDDADSPLKAAGRKKNDKVLPFKKYGPKSCQQEASRSLTTYGSLCVRTQGDAPRDSIFEVIERDLTRTFPKNKFFETKVVDGGRADRDVEAGGISSLRRILRSYAAYDAEVEYCQGMNYVAALLIIHVCRCDDDDDDGAVGVVSENDPTKSLKMAQQQQQQQLSSTTTTTTTTTKKAAAADKKKKKAQTTPPAISTTTPKKDASVSLDGSPEEEAFWLFVAALKSPRTSLRDLYRPGMVGSRRALFVYDKLLKDAAPSIHAHLDHQGVIPDMYATHWLVTVFTAQFPFALVARVWDVFLAEGWKPVFKTAIAVLLTFDAQIKAKPFEQLLTFLKELPDILDVDKVLHVADTKVHLTSDQLKKHELAFMKTLQE